MPALRFRRRHRGLRDGEACDDLWGLRPGLGRRSKVGTARLPPGRDELECGQTVHGGAWQIAGKRMRGIPAVPVARRNAERVVLALPDRERHESAAALPAAEGVEAEQ